MSNNLNRLIKKLPDSEAKTQLQIRSDALKKSSPFIAVRHNLLYHYFGFREPEILHYTDNKTMNKIKDLFKRLDMLWKEIVKVAKTNIVVRGLPVLFWNIVSNIFLAIIQGRNPVDEIRKQFEGVLELNKLREDMRKLNELKIKREAGTSTKAEDRQYKILINNIRNNKAYPLYQAGLYTSSVDEINMPDIYNQSWFDNALDKYVDKLPDGAKKLVDILFVTKNTDFFRALLLSMQYGDFSARYAEYYRLIREGMSKEDAIKRVLDNQINYAFNTGKIKHWLNARGFLMFTKFYERIQRVILRVAKERPANILLSGALGTELFEKSPFADFMLLKDPTDYIHAPSDVLSEIFERPALLQMLTGKY